MVDALNPAITSATQWFEHHGRKRGWKQEKKISVHAGRELRITIWWDLIADVSDKRTGKLKTRD